MVPIPYYRKVNDEYVLSDHITVDNISNYICLDLMYYGFYSSDRIVNQEFRRNNYIIKVKERRRTIYADVLFAKKEDFMLFKLKTGYDKSVIHLVNIDYDNIESIEWKLLGNKDR